MKRRGFLTLVCAAGGAAAAIGIPRTLLARDRIASIEVRTRGDRQWMHGRPGACAAAWKHRLKWSGYTLEQLLA